VPVRERRCCVPGTCWPKWPRSSTSRTTGIQSAAARPLRHWLTEIRPRQWIQTALDQLPFIPHKPPQPITQGADRRAGHRTLWENLTTDTDGKSYVINLTYSARDPSVASAIVNTADGRPTSPGERAQRVGERQRHHEFFNKRVEDLRLQLEAPIERSRTTWSIRSARDQAGYG